MRRNSPSPNLSHKGRGIRPIIPSPSTGEGQGEGVPKIQGVIFDIDGVLVDTRKSYLEAIRLTTDLYLTQVLGLRNQGSLLLSARDVESFKMVGGFNNDWDCVEGLLLYLLSHLSPSQLMQADSEVCLRSECLAKKTYREAASIFKVLQKKKNIPGLLRSKDRSFLRRRDIRKLVSYGKIVQIFQEVYLGKRMYEQVYKTKSLYWKKAGLYLKETPLLTTSFFQDLKKRGLKLGIATGRNRFETLMVLDRFGWKRFFPSIVTADETPLRFSKPHPYVLLRNGKKLKALKLIYVGDLPDDMKAAKRANKRGLAVTAIGFLKGVDQKSAMRRELLRAGASRTARSTSELRNYLGNYGPVHS